MINIGDNNIVNIYIGADSIGKVYIGDTIVYDNSAPPVPPTPQTDDYLTFEALEDGTFSFTNDGLEYSTDEGQTWTALAANTQTPVVHSGETVMFRGEMTPTSEHGIGTFSSTGQFNITGNIMSLLFGDDFIGKTSFPSGSTYTFQDLFLETIGLVDASKIVLPATTLANDCYYRMFHGCTSLTTAPALPATTLAERCYRGMFRNCTSLTTAPALPATTLEDWCYRNMFRNCTSLATAPALPATTLADGCYSYMFAGCTSLTTAPSVLPATTLVQNCYEGMFNGCTSLTTAPDLPSTTLEDFCYYYMFNGCASLNYIKVMAINRADYSTTRWVEGVSETGTFVENINAQWGQIGEDGIPTGWTVETASE